MSSMEEAMKFPSYCSGESLENFENETNPKIATVLSSKTYNSDQLNYSHNVSIYSLHYHQVSEPWISQVSLSTLLKATITNISPKLIFLHPHLESEYLFSLVPFAEIANLSR